MCKKDLNTKKPCNIDGVTNCKITDIEKEFLLEDYTEGEEFEILNGKYKVVKNDLKQIVLEPIECNLLYKYSFDLEAKTETYRQIIDGKIVDSKG